MADDHRKRKEERVGLELTGISQELTWTCI